MIHVRCEWNIKFKFTDSLFVYIIPFFFTLKVRVFIGSTIAVYRIIYNINFKKDCQVKKKATKNMILSLKVEYFSDLINICHTKQVFVFDVVHIIVFNHLCLMIFSLFRLFLLRRIKSLWFHVIFIILLNSN